MSINVENLTKLINHMKKVNKENFNMGVWANSQDDAKFLNRPVKELVDYMQTGKGDCGTAACIAGHAALLSFAEKNMRYYDQIHNNIAEEEASEWLGLEVGGDLADDLFCPHALHLRTLPEAIGVLELLLKTAKEGDPQVEWPEA